MKPSLPQPSTPVSDTSVESHVLAKKMTGSKLPEVLWPSTMRSLSVSFQSDSISIPVFKKKEKEKSVSHGNLDRTLKPTSNVAQKQVESPRKLTPERKRSPLKGKNSCHQSENSRPVDSSQSKLIDQHRWPSRIGGRLSSNIMTKSVDLTDRTGKISIARPLHKTLSDSSEQSEFDDQIGALGFRLKSVDDSLVRPGSVVPGALVRPGSVVPGALVRPGSVVPGALVRPGSVIPAALVRPGSVPGSRLPSPSRVSISRAPPSPSKTRPSTPTQSRGASPLRIRQSSPTRQSSSTPSVLNFVADIKKGKKDNQLEEAHQLRLLYNRHLQWRFANARAKAALYIQRITAEVRIFFVNRLKLHYY